MDAVLPFLIVAGGYGVVMGCLAWLGSRARRGVGGEVMGPVEEIFHPAAHHFRPEIRAAEERMAPNPSADDRWGRGAAGRGRPNPR